MTDMMRRIQLLNVGAIYYFIKLDLNVWGVTETIRFHGNGAVYEEDGENKLIPHGDMTYQGEVYSFAHFSIEGLQISNDGKVNKPTLRVGNRVGGQDGFVSALCALYGNLVGAKLTLMITTEEAYTVGTDQAEIQYWWIDRKSNDNELFVEFELTSPLDFKRQQIPTRLISDICFWAIRGEYRGENCGYTGTRYFNEKGEPVDSITLDKCGGTCDDCALRFGEGEELPFGGFLIPYRTDY